MGTTADTTEVTLGLFRQLNNKLLSLAGNYRSASTINQLRNAPPLSHLIRQANSRKSATAGTLHLRRPLMTNRGGLLLLQPREG